MNAQEIFSAQTENIQELQRAWGQINRDVNKSYLKNKSDSVRLQTKLMALVYCALAEAIFSKLIHTPNCFTSDQVIQIKKRTSDAGVKSGWLKCLELALGNVEGHKSGYVPNVKQSLERLINEYIFDPSILRNKLAHGQWVNALNREHSAINSDLTSEISSLTVVELYRRKTALEKLASIMTDIIESPTKAHPRDYWSQTSELDEELKRMATWTVQRKVDQLRKKYSWRENQV